jgi:type IV pilus biogenesis protein PilP
MSVLKLQDLGLAGVRVAIAVAALLACATGSAQPGSAATPSAVPMAAAPSTPAAAMPAAPAAVPLPSSPMSAATAAEIQKINEQMTLLQAQLNQLELKARIASKQKEINGTAASPPLQSSFDAKSGNPSVVSVAGLKGQLEAVLVFPGGVTTRVRTGDVIDERRVAKVAINEVVLTDLKGRNVQRLAFGTSAMTREHTPLVPGNGMPPSPLLPLPPAMPQAMLR